MQGSSRSSRRLSRRPKLQQKLPLQLHFPAQAKRQQTQARKVKQHQPRSRVFLQQSVSPNKHSNQVKQRLSRLQVLQSAWAEHWHRQPPPGWWQLGQRKHSNQMLRNSGSSAILPGSWKIQHRLPLNSSKVRAEGRTQHSIRGRTKCRKGSWLI